MLIFRWFQHDWAFSAVRLSEENARTPAARTQAGGRDPSWPAFPISIDQVDLETFDARPPVSREVPLRTENEPELVSSATIQLASAGTLSEVWPASGPSVRAERRD